MRECLRDLEFTYRKCNSVTLKIISDCFMRIILKLSLAASATNLKSLASSNPNSKNMFHMIMSCWLLYFKLRFSDPRFKKVMKSGPGAK